LNSLVLNFYDQGEVVVIQAKMDILGSPLNKYSGVAILKKVLPKSLITVARRTPGNLGWWRRELVDGGLIAARRALN
jgi:hypothetical protein